eukprot:366932-Amphidinium_carterae.1
MKKWEEQFRAYERKKNELGQEEKLPETILMATLEALCPPQVEAHFRLNHHARLQTCELLRSEVLNDILLPCWSPASLRAPESAAGSFVQRVLDRKGGSLVLQKRPNM